MTRILVTGASGHLGANVVRSLLRHGHAVVPFVRPTSDLRGLDGLGLSPCYGDILEIDSLKEAMQGCESVVHTAAVYRMVTTNPDNVTQPAIAGTRNVFRAANVTGVRRIVYTSTTFAVGSSTDPHTLRTADDWNDEIHMPYTAAKVQAEKLAWQLADDMNIELITLCPNGILGPYDFAITPTTANLLKLLNGSGVTSLGGASFVDVRDVAEIHAQAVEHSVAGQRYIIAGENVTMKALGETITRLTGIKPRHVPLARGAMLLVATLMEMGSRLSGSEPIMTRAMARELVGRYHYYDSEKTRQAFGITPRPTDETVLGAIRWLLYLGEIEPQIAQRLDTLLPLVPKWRPDLV